MSQGALILLVEDDRDIRESLADVLEEEGYRVAHAADGESAVAALGALAGGERPALILLDMWMPRMDARGFREAQMREAAWAAIPTVLMTGERDAAGAARAMGVAAVLKKPVTIDALLKVIEEHAR